MGSQKNRTPLSAHVHFSVIPKQDLSLEVRAGNTVGSMWRRLTEAQSTRVGTSHLASAPGKHTGGDTRLQSPHSTPACPTLPHTEAPGLRPRALHLSLSTHRVRSPSISLPTHHRLPCQPLPSKKPPDSLSSWTPTQPPAPASSVQSPPDPAPIYPTLRQILLPSVSHQRSPEGYKLNIFAQRSCGPSPALPAALKVHSHLYQYPTTLPLIPLGPSTPAFALPQDSCPLTPAHQPACQPWKGT